MLCNIVVFVLFTLSIAEMVVLEKMVNKEGFERHPIFLNKDSKMIRLSVALKHKNGEGLKKKLDVLGDPESPSYAQWLTIEEVDAYLTPTEEKV